MAVKLWLSGDWSAVTELRHALEGDPGIEVVGEAGGAVAVVHVAGDDVRAEIAAVREHAHAPIVFLARSGAGDLLEAALEAEVADVLILPQPAEAVIFAVQRAVAGAARRRVERSRARVVTVFSPKGGTGKTVIASNLAVALAAQGQRTLLVDLDLQFGDVAIMLGLQPQRTLHDLLTAPGSLDAEKISGYSTQHAGVDVLAAPLKPEDAETIADSRVGDLLDAARGGYDVIVVDTPPFFHSTVLTALDRTDDLLMVCTPDVPTMKNVRLTLQTLELLSFDAQHVRLILNRANARIGFRSVQVAAVLERAVEFELPEDETVGIAVNRGESAMRFKPSAPFPQAIVGLGVSIGVGGMAPVPRTASRRRFLLGRRR